SDGTREVGAYVIDNPHSNGLMIGYVSDARIGYATDIWSPGAAPLPDKLTPPLAALVAGVKKAGITPAKFAGGHGGVGGYAPLAALEGKEVSGRPPRAGGGGAHPLIRRLPPPRLERPLLLPATRQPKPRGPR